MANFPRLLQILEQKTILHHDYECSKQMPLKMLIQNLHRKSNAAQVKTPDNPFLVLI